MRYDGNIKSMAVFMALVLRKAYNGITDGCEI